MSIPIQLVLLFLSANPPPAAPPLDAGTWLRKSISILPVAVAACQKTPQKELRAEWKRNHPKKNPSRDDIAALAHRNSNLCDDVRRDLQSRQVGYTAIAGLHRFDANPLDPMAQDHLSQALERDGFGSKFEKALRRELGLPLAALLDRTSLDRARSLESDFQLNSMVAEKTKTEDINAAQTAMTRGSAYLFALRIDGLRLSRAKAGWSVRARSHLEIWTFDPLKRTFQLRARFNDDVGGRLHPEPDDLASSVWSHTGFDDRILALEEFRFTAQLEEISQKGLRPAGILHANTDADLRVHRRFVYLENRLVPGQGTVRKLAGWGYLDQVDHADSLYRLRHLGGQDPYAGLVVEEVPGTSWQILSLSPISQRSRDPAPSGPPPAARFAPTSAIGWELRLGTRGNLPGDPANQNLLFDVMIGSNPVDATVENRDQQVSVLQSGTWMGSLGAETGWTTRFPIRRLALTAGVVAGARWLVLPLHQARYDPGIVFKAEPEPAAGFARLDRTQAWLGLRAGAQWSLSVANGIGLETGWEALRYQGGWTTGGAGASRSVAGGTQAGPGPWRLSLQWIFG